MTDFIGMKTHVSNTEKDDVKAAFWCEKEVAKYLGVSVNLLRKCRADGTFIPHYKFSNSVRYSIAEFEEYIAASRRDFTGQPANENREIDPTKTKGDSK